MFLVKASLFWDLRQILAKTKIKIKNKLYIPNLKWYKLNTPIPKGMDRGRKGLEQDQKPLGHTWNPMALCSASRIECVECKFQRDWEAPPRTFLVAPLTAFPLGWPYWLPAAFLGRSFMFLSSLISGSTAPLTSFPLLPATVSQRHNAWHSRPSFEIWVEASVILQLIHCSCQ